jgi:putative tryptophan/tyrosine transport system substrate-binding protein
VLRRQILQLALASGMTAGPPASAQRAKAVRIGVLWQTAPPPPVHPHIAALLAQLETLGWQEGRNVEFVFRYARDDARRLAEAADDLVRMDVAVIATAGDLSTRAAQQATSTIAIVALVGHPVESGFARSLSRPGTNITGFAVIADHLAVKRLELLKELVPRLERVAALWDPITHERQAKAAQEAARGLGLHVDIVHADAAKGVHAAFEKAESIGAQAVLVLISPALIGKRLDVARAAAERRLPTIYHSPVFTEVGGLMAYGPSLEEQWRQLAATIDRILKGARADELPFQQPTRFELDINLKAARALGLAIPESILLRANRVIQ